MAFSKRYRTVVGLDIGTTKICTLVAELRPEGVKIIGAGVYPSDGLRKGIVIDLEGTVDSIKSSVEEAERTSGIRIHSVVTGIAGGHIKSFNTTASLPIRSYEVTERDVQRVQEMARSIDDPTSREDREVIGTEIQEYCLDEQTGIKDPVGMSGKKLTVYMHVVTAAVASAQNLIKAANMAGLDVDDIVLQPLASAKAVLAEEEKEMGVALADFGGGTTDLAVYFKGTVRHTSVLPLGGDNLTYDLAVGLRVSKPEAEKVKREFGFCHKAYLLEDKTIDITEIGGKVTKGISSKRVLEVLEPRVTEIFNLLQEELEQKHLTRLMNMGFVLTGGSSVLPGMEEKAREIFNVPVRIGYPMGILGPEAVSSPMYATAVGLILHAAGANKKLKKFSRRQGHLFFKILETMKNWFR